MSISNMPCRGFKSHCLRNTIYKHWIVQLTKDYVLLNAHEIIAVPAQKETENKSSSTLNAAATNGSHHLAIAVSDESYYRDSLKPENMSDASNDDQKPNTIFIDADYLNDPLSTNEASNKIDNNISEDSNSDDFELNRVYPPLYLVNFTGFSVQYALNTAKLIVTWVYEDPTLFRGRG
ncbi:unnamed protein product [Schistosoma curassoni]|uniref:Integrase, catalytic region, zinc finger, CCHC-type, peptidase aspartic, catalytic n=1 Tax=Schistosoma curassoni TaxID=6186 RepID=A0A183KPS0_9TREM|nr:unnamed protein product [Schistosoma curassoni]